MYLNLIMEGAVKNNDNTIFFKKYNFIRFMTILFLIITVSKSANAESFKIVCNRWQDMYVAVFKRAKLHYLCTPAPYGWDCKIGVQCVEWKVEVDHDKFYSDIIKSFDIYKKDFTKYVIEMLDTVTLQKIYDPNMISR